MTKKPIFLIAVVVILIALAGGVGWWFSRRDVKQETLTKPYYAVFLTNGQVYFGTVKKSTDKTLTLSDVYYLQVQQAIQPPEKKAGQEEQPKISLVKLGEEIHGPKDEMAINREQVLFTEEMKTEGQVMQTIKKHKNGELTPTTSTTPATTPTTTEPKQ